jgi:hypothetical protein
LRTIKDKTIRQQAIHNILIQHNEIIDIDKNQLVSNYFMAINSFMWTKTKQGYIYWKTISLKV